MTTLHNLIETSTNDHKAKHQLEVHLYYVIKNIWPHGMTGPVWPCNISMVWQIVGSFLMMHCLTSKFQTTKIFSSQLWKSFRGQKQHIHAIEILLREITFITENIKANYWLNYGIHELSLLTFKYMKYISILMNK